MNQKDWITAMVIFVFATFFSATSWANQKSKSKAYNEGNTTSRVKIEGITHSLIGGLISVVLFAFASHFYADWGLLLQGSVSVACGALLGEAFILYAERRINNDKLI